MGRRDTPKTFQDRLLCRGGAGLREGVKGKREGACPGLPQLWGLCLFPPSLLLAVRVWRAGKFFLGGSEVPAVPGQSSVPRPRSVFTPHN